MNQKDDQPRLTSRIQELLDQLEGRVSNLKDDPLRDWFELELNQYRIADANEMDLQEANSRLQALKQLSHLLFEHCVKIQNPDYQKPIENFPDSFLTVQARLPANVLATARKHKFSIDPQLLHDPNRDNESFVPVSPTAQIVGYLRGLDRSLSLPTKFLVGNEGENLLDELDIRDRETRSLMAILFQSRYHAINAAIASSSLTINQIIEFAAGISPRGFQWSQMSPGTIYVESDLPQLMIHKSKRIRNALLQRETVNRGILHCCAADVLDWESVSRPLQDFDSTLPLIIVTEGLLLYFTKQEMEQFWRNMYKLLSQHPHAVWITDLVTRENLSDLMGSHPGVAEAVGKVFRLTRRKVVDGNPFQNDEDVMQFLQRFGLRCNSTLGLKEALTLVQIEDPALNQIADVLVGNRKIWQVSA
ncbi:MAG: class I SAM-dependent methyltransferase [Planctomycetota bacterium]